MIRYVPPHPVAVAIVTCTGTTLPILLAYSLFHDPADFSHNGIAFDMYVHIPKAAAIQENQTFLRKDAALVTDVSHLAMIWLGVVVGMVFHLFVRLTFIYCLYGINMGLT